MNDFQIFIVMAVGMILLYFLIKGSISYYFKSKGDFVDRLSGKMKGDGNAKE